MCVCFCTYVCMYVCMYACMYAHICVCTRIYLKHSPFYKQRAELEIKTRFVTVDFAWSKLYVCMHACMYVCMYACIFVCTYIAFSDLSPSTSPGRNICMYGMHVCVYVCMYVYVLYVASRDFSSSTSSGYIYVYIYIHTHTHTHTHNTYSKIHTLKHACKHKYIHAYVPRTERADIHHCQTPN
jgi:hypothetical protein